MLYSPAKPYHMAGLGLKMDLRWHSAETVGSRPHVVGEHCTKSCAQFILGRKGWPISSLKWLQGGPSINHWHCILGNIKCALGCSCNIIQYDAILRTSLQWQKRHKSELALTKDTPYPTLGVYWWDYEENEPLYSIALCLHFHLRMEMVQWEKGWTS